MGVLLPLGGFSRDAAADFPLGGSGDAVGREAMRAPQMMLGVEFGHTKLLDTYLTPIYYSGTHYALSFEHQQATGFSPESWERQLQLRADYSLTHNPADNHTTHALTATARWAIYYRHPLPVARLQFFAGPDVVATGGVLYNPSLSNNVANARVRAAAGLTAGAQWTTRVRHTPLTLRYQASLPVIGAFFSPDYDETYYEIYLGNREHLVHLASWGNRFDLDQRLTADWQFRGTTLRVGYACAIERSHTRGIYTRLTTHSLIVAVGGIFSSQTQPPNK